MAEWFFVAFRMTGGTREAIAERRKRDCFAPKMQVFRLLTVERWFQRGLHTLVADSRHLTSV